MAAVALIKAVDGPNFGVNLDTANFLRVLDDPVEATRKLAPHAESPQGSRR